MATKSNYRHVGAKTSVGTQYQFKKFGQLVELDDDLGLELRAFSTFVTDAQFQTYGFDPEDLKKHWNTATHANAPSDFQARRNKLWADLPALREEAKTEWLALHPVAPPTPVPAETVTPVEEAE